VHAGKLGQVTNFRSTIVGGTAEHCINQYMVLFHYCSLGATLLCRMDYILGFATHSSCTAVVRDRRRLSLCCRALWLDL